jgi:3-oxoacyl-(acyl-carrier-protein) synthase
MGAALSHDERRLTAHRPTKPAPEVAPAAPAVRVKIDEIELFAVVDNYEALQDAFADRIEDLNVTMTEIDAAAGMTRGQVQKLLRKLDPNDFRPSAKRKYSRGFGWKTLGNSLKGTGLALAVIVDDERFAPIRAQMAKRLLPSRK